MALKPPLYHFQLSSKEVFFQVILHIVVFFLFSFDKDNPAIQQHQVVFFLNYTLAAFFINYVLLGQFLYKKRYWSFFLLLTIIIALAILIEESVLEQIYFPDTRGKSFPGIMFNLLEILPVLSILSAFKFAWDALSKQQEVEDLKATIQESELQFLKSQINPHFLFNNLNNLYSYAIENSPKTPNIILELSAVLRYMLYECKEEYVPLTKEIKHLENFTRLSELQIEERGRISFLKSPNLSGYQIAPLILVVFIENAFKHSQSSQSKDIKIDIKIEMSEAGKLDFYCVNNFQKMTNTKNLSKGIGLQNVRKRLELLYPNAHQLNIAEENELYEVHLSLWLEKEESIV